MKVKYRTRRMWGSIRDIPEEEALKLEKENKVELLEDPDQGGDPVSTCQGVKSDGTDCQRKVTDGEYCHFHEPEDEDE